MDRRSAAGLDATPSQQLKAGIDKVNDAFGTTGKTLAEARAEVKKTGGAERLAEFDEAMKKSRDTVMESLGVEKAGVVSLRELAAKLKDAGATAGETAQAMRKQNDSFMSALGIAKTPFETLSGALDNIAEQFDMAGVPLDQVRRNLAGNAEQLKLFDRAVKTARDNLLSSLGIEKTPQEVYNEKIKEIDEAENSTDPNKQITKKQADLAKANATAKRDEALGAGGASSNFSKGINEQKANIEGAYGVGGAADPEKYRLAMDNLAKKIPGASPEDPMTKFKNEMKQLESVRGTIGEDKFAENKLNLQAQLQEDMKPALDKMTQDRRGVEAGGDARGKGGVDTFFRILRGNDNPSLKAQLDIAKNTKILADAAGHPDAAPVILQMGAR